MKQAQIETRQLRDAFGCFATGITIVTALDRDGQPVGITANSLTSVSLDPPLLLWCLDKRSVTSETFENSPNFVVSVLSTKAAALASRFAMKNGHAVEGVETVPTGLGPPTFPDALAVFECDVEARYPGGDHVIMVGRIRRFTCLPEPHENGSGPLLYYRGRYGTWRVISG